VTTIQLSHITSLIARVPLSARNQRRNIIAKGSHHPISFCKNSNRWGHRKYIAISAIWTALELQKRRCGLFLIICL